MEFGDLDDIIQPSVTRSSRHQAPYSPKCCKPQWFLDDSQCTDEDDIKFRADFYYQQKNYQSALDTYMGLLKEKRFGKNRSLMSEVYESIALCYRRLGEDENAKLFCLKSDELCKSADHKLTNLYIQSRILLSEPSKELSNIMKKLLILHPYNHFLWLEYSNLQTDPLFRLLYLIRTRLLLDINLKGVQDLIKNQHKAMTQQVNDLIGQHSSEVSEEKLSRVESHVKSQDIEERSQEEWQTEEYKLKVIEEMTSEEVDELFSSRWESLITNVT